MESDLSILKQKFVNFKKFIRECAKDNEKTKMLLSQSEDEMIERSVLLYMIFKKTGSLELIVNTTSVELGIEKPADKEKLGRYFQCFIDYNAVANKNVDVQIKVNPEDKEKFEQLIKSKLQNLKLDKKD